MNDQQPDSISRRTEPDSAAIPADRVESQPNNHLLCRSTCCHCGHVEIHKFREAINRTHCPECKVSFSRVAFERKDAVKFQFIEANQ